MMGAPLCSRAAMGTGGCTRDVFDLVRWYAQENVAWKTRTRVEPWAGTKGWETSLLRLGPQIVTFELVLPRSKESLGLPQNQDRFPGPRLIDGHVVSSK